MKKKTSGTQKKSSNWVKSVVVDLVITAVIVYALLQPNEILFTIIFGYTLLILLLKGTVLFGGTLASSRIKKSEQAPELVIYGLYVINAVCLFLAQQPLAAAGWLIITILSWMAMRKIESTVKNKGKRRTKN